MKKMFTLMALALVVSLAGYAQKHHVAPTQVHHTATKLKHQGVTAQKLEMNNKVLAPKAKRVSSMPLMAAQRDGSNPIKVSKAQAAAKAPEAVTPPENAEAYYYTFDGSAYTPSNDSWQGPYTLSRTVKVIYDDDDVYVSGLSYYGEDAFVKGSWTDDNTVTFEKGQYIGNYGADVYFGATDDQNNFIDVVATYNYDEDSFTFSTIIGACAMEDGNYKGLYAYVDEGATLSPAGEDALIPIEPPTSLKTEDYLFYGDNYWKGQSGQPDYVSRVVKVGFYGNDVYVQGFCDRYPEAWMKGTLEGNKVTFDVYTYLGTYINTYDFYTLGMTAGYEEANIEFTYDATEGKFTCLTNFFTIYFEYIRRIGIGTD